MTEISLRRYEDYFNDYRRNDECGRGKFGTVYNVTHLKSGKSFASKHVRIRKSDQRQKVLSEIEILQKISNPHIVKFKEAFESFNEIIIITEYLYGGELFDRIATEEFEITEQDCCLYLRQLCRGVEYLHKQNILHLDLKPENIVCMDKNSAVIKIIDFGLAKLVRPGEKVKTMCGSVEFLSPEVVNYDYVSHKTDMWSVGVITYILLSGYSPFMGDTDAETQSNIIKNLYDFDEPEFDLISSNAKDFISRLLILNARNRVSATECLNHPWLLEQDIGTEKLETARLRKFQARRRWQRFGKAVEFYVKTQSIIVRRRSMRLSLQDHIPNPSDNDIKCQETILKRLSSCPTSEPEHHQHQPKFQVSNRNDIKLRQSNLEKKTLEDNLSSKAKDEKVFNEQKDSRLHLPDLIKEIVTTNSSNSKKENEDIVVNSFVKMRIRQFETRERDDAAMTSRNKIK